MSGGVDSSVAALLLKRKGYEVIGVFMRCFNVDGCAEKDAEDARRVAEKLKIPFYVWDFEKEYKKRVVDYMVSGYREGITPNPDVMCNREIKFGLFLKKALAMGADYVATGHYVRLASRRISTGTGRLFAPAAKSGLDSRRIESRRASGHQAQSVSETFRAKYGEKLVFCLFEAKDRNKDQSYFLWTLTQEQLKRCLFPIGDYLKSEVRVIAGKAGLATAAKKDSQGICFLGKVKLGDFLTRYIPEKRGVVLNAQGEKIGEHSGSYFYTIGQRHGLALSGRRSASGLKETQPLYVAEKNVKTNTLVIAEGEDNPALFKKEIQLAETNLIYPFYSNVLKNIRIAENKIKVLARVRYRQPLTSAVLKLVSKQRAGLVFDKPQKFVASGQSAVFYSRQGEMLGGGVIK